MLHLFSEGTSRTTLVATMASKKLDAMAGAADNDEVDNDEVEGGDEADMSTIVSHEVGGSGFKASEETKVIVCRWTSLASSRTKCTSRDGQSR